MARAQVQYIGETQIHVQYRRQGRVKADDWVAQQVGGFSAGPLSAH